MFRLDDNFVFCGNFVFSLLISAKKNNNHQKTKLPIQPAHHYTDNMTLLCQQYIFWSNIFEKKGTLRKHFWGSILYRLKLKIVPI